MSKGWKYADEVAERVGSDGIFIMLKNDKDKFIGACVGDPHVEEVIWNEKTNRNEPYTKAHEAAGKKASARFYLNFYVTAEGNGDKVKGFDKPSVRVLNCSVKTYRRIQKAREKYPQDKWFWEIERSGGKGDPKTEFSVLPDKEIPEAVQKELSRAALAHEAFLEKGTKVPEGVLQLHDLVKVAKNDNEEDAEAKKVNGSGSNGSGVLDQIKKRLKDLPRTQWDLFLTRFGVSAVKDVKPEDFEKAIEFILDLEKKNAELENKKPAPVVENDPFA